MPTPRRQTCCINQPHAVARNGTAGQPKGDAVKPTLDPLAHSPGSAAQRLGLPIRAVYTLIANGDLRSYKDGKRRLIPDTECQRHVQRKLAQAAK